MSVTLGREERGAPLTGSGSGHHAFPPLAGGLEPGFPSQAGSEVQREVRGGSSHVARGLMPLTPYLSPLGSPAGVATAGSPGSQALRSPV